MEHPDLAYQRDVVIEEVARQRRQQVKGGVTITWPRRRCNDLFVTELVMRLRVDRAEPIPCVVVGDSNKALRSIKMLIGSKYGEHRDTICGTLDSDWLPNPQQVCTFGTLDKLENGLSDFEVVIVVCSVPSPRQQKEAAAAVRDHALSKFVVCVSLEAIDHIWNLGFPNIALPSA